MIPALGPRRIDPEILDTLPPGQAAASLADLVRLNRDFGGHSTLRSLLKRTIDDRFEPLTFLDIGGASGDMATVIGTACPGAFVTLLDHVASHMETAQTAKVCGDAFALPFRDASFDYVFSSLFLHHFENPAVTRLFAEMARVARRGVLTIDLIRSPLAYWFLAATEPFCHWDPVTLHDGPISFAAGFRAAELRRLAHAAGLHNINVKSHRPAWRYSLSASKRDFA